MTTSESQEQKISLGSVLDRVMVTPAEAHVFLSQLAQSIGHGDIQTAMSDVANDIAYGRQSGGTQPESTRQPLAPTDDTPEGSQASTGTAGHAGASGPSSPPSSRASTSRSKDDD